eukprot:TRINITY_DN9821_c0_g1_i7.p1 TRINITY_DN9821_c0_g1~~TRINITY_DN9821_c0_g1_i7.p1  ORF type:complete len:479 (+),score=135.23 TRINITY_DN9821_c0_g1_i7:109-1437(+)
MSAAELGYGATEATTPGEAADYAASVAECRLCAAIVSLSLSAALGAATYAAGAQVHPAMRGADAAGNGSLPPAVELMREVPASLTEYVVDPYALCTDFKHAQQPVFVSMLQSGLMTVSMSFMAMLPPPLGGGHPFHPGVVGFVFAGWNVFAALKLIYETLFVTALPSGLALSPFERYELRWWLAAQNPKFQSMVTIFMHKLLGVFVTILEPEKKTGKMEGWRKGATIAIWFSAGAGFVLVALPLLVTHLLAQLVFLPVGVLLNLLSLDFYKMLLGTVCATILTAGLIVGPAASLMFCGASLYPPKYGDKVSAAHSLIHNKGSSVLALLLAVFIQDFTVNSMLVYHRASGPGAAQLSAYGARQTCAWAECAALQLEGSTAWQRVNEWIELAPVLHAAAGLIPVDCYAADGSVTHHANMLAFLIAMGAVLLITVIGMPWLLKQG